MHASRRQCQVYSSAGHGVLAACCLCGCEGPKGVAMLQSAEQSPLTDGSSIAPAHGLVAASLHAGLKRQVLCASCHGVPLSPVHASTTCVWPGWHQLQQQLPGGLCQGAGGAHGGLQEGRASSELRVRADGGACVRQQRRHLHERLHGQVPAAERGISIWPLRVRCAPASKLSS